MPTDIEAPPSGKEATRLWRELSRQDRFHLWHARRMPNTRQEALTALGHARRLRANPLLAMNPSLVWTAVTVRMLALVLSVLAFDYHAEGDLGTVWPPTPWETAFALALALAAGLLLDSYRARRLEDRAERSLTYLKSETSDT